MKHAAQVMLMPGRQLRTPPTDDPPGPGQRLVRLRWWVPVVAEAVVVAIVLVLYLVLTDGSAPYPVTDVPAPGSAPSLVASGIEGGQPWRITVKPNGPGQVCWTWHSQVLGGAIPVSCTPLRTPDPVGFDDNYAFGPAQVGLGVVQADVTSVVFRLVDGQELKLIPVKRYGYRLVAFVIPRQPGIARATAYLNNGHYATTTPINYPEGLAFFPPWQFR